MLFALLLAAADPGVPAASSISEAPAASTAEADRNKVRCKSVQQVGTRLGGKKLCMTKAQWEEAATNAMRVTRDLQMRNGLGAGGRGAAPGAPQP
jgi:hypothetical protein